MRPGAHTAWPTQGLKKQSEWLGGRGGHKAEHTPPSPGAAGEPGRPAWVPRTPPQSPFLWCGDLRNPKPREPPAPGAGTKGCSPRGSLRLFFRGSRRPAALPTLPAPARSHRFSTHPTSVRRAAHRRRRSGHGQSDGGQARTGAAASGAAPTHADLFKSNSCCNTFK
uniref:Signal transducer CD24 n=1 Tax=Callorhinus ursinus TaxID=34884 RepID=A0A3Q7NLF7_CALUR|nr:signal transducer CD24 [Callorhinus ursinus]